MIPAAMNPATMIPATAIRRRRRPALMLALVLLLAGAGLLSISAQGQAVPPQPDGLEALIAPYRDVLRMKMGEVLAVSPAEMRARDPEGPLGNLVCDIVLDRARAATGMPVDICVLNNGGLRAALPPGSVTLGHVYEIMPFDNEIVVLRLSGPQIRVLADEIAAAGGEPVAGLSLAIRDGRAVELLVGGNGDLAPVADREYLVATSDYLANRGGQMEALWHPIVGQILTGVLVRDALVDAFRAAGAQSMEPDEIGELPVPALGRVRKASGGAR